MLRAPCALLAATHSLLRVTQAHCWTLVYPTEASLNAECDANPACIGYTYGASGEYCRVHGPGLDTDLAGGWHAFTRPATTTIARAAGDLGHVCVAVAGRN